MFAGKILAPRRSAGLKEQRRALRRGFAEVNALHPVVPSVMPHRPHPGGIGKYPPRLVAQHRVVVPAAFPELVEDLEILFCRIVAGVMVRLLFHAHAAGGAVEIAGDDVPADPPLGQVIQRRHAPRQKERRLVGRVDGDAEAQMFGDMRHGRNRDQRIIDRDLCAGLDRRRRAAPVDVVDPDDIGQEQPVELAALGSDGQIRPVIEIGIAHRLVARMRPEAMVDVADAVHVEGVNLHFFHIPFPCLAIALFTVSYHSGEKTQAPR